MLSATLRNKPAKKTSNLQTQGYILPIESVLVRMQRIVANETATTYQVCQVIALNPMLQYDIIVSANAQRKSSREIVDLYQAVMFLGMEKVLSIITSRLALMQ